MRLFHPVTRNSRGFRLPVPALAVATLLLATVDARAQVSLTTVGTPYTQNFDTLPPSGSTTWTNNSNVPGWFHARTGTGTTIVANDGSSNAGNLYSYGTGTATDRALGSLGSGNAAIGNLFWGVRLQNNTGVTITSLDISYTGEQWRNSAAAAQTAAFSYLVGSPTVTGSLAEFQSAGVAVTALDFVGPITGGAAGALNGNLAANRTAKIFTITGLSIPNGTQIMLRWSDPDHTGADHGLSIDDFSVTPGAAGPADSAPAVASTTPTNNATGVPLASNISVTFSEPVNAPAGAFSISCASSGIHSFVLSGGATTFTLNPNSDFSQNEVCTVTVDDVQISDVDATDPPDNMAADFVFSFTTVDLSTCGTAFTPTYAIQGSGAATPIPGPGVSTEGIAVGDFQGGTNLSGFYLQDPTGDGNTLTSDGIYVFDGASPGVDVAVGDRVRVTGTVAEAFGNTQITPTSVIVCSTGNPLPPATVVSLPEAVNNDLERYENMLATFPQTLTVTGNFDLGSFGELVLSSGGRLFQQNSFDRPGSAGSLAVAAANVRRYVLLDDGRSVSNIDPTPYYSATPTRRVGDTTTGLTGVLTYDFGDYRVQPTGPVTFSDDNPRPAPPVITGNIKAVGMNVLNYFNGDGAGGGFPTSRGANTLAEFNRQRAKIIAAIVAISPDVLGISEMENDGFGPTSAIQDLVTGINAASAPGTYAFISNTAPGATGTDAIMVAIIYKPGVLSPVGPPVSDTNPIHNRPPEAQLFQKISNGERFTFIVNHFKSKGGSCPGSGGDADAGDGQGCFNAARIAQANALMTFIQQRKVAAGDPDVLSVGDYNSYGEEDPLFAMEQDAGDVLADGAGGLVSQSKRYIPASDRYSYQFASESGELDHVMATKSMDLQTTGALVWHNNADEPTVLDYNVESKSPAQQALNVGTPYRASDHDPIIVGLILTAADLSIDKNVFNPPGPTVPAGGLLSYTIRVTNNGPDAASNPTWTDALPAGTTFQSLPPWPGWSCITPPVGTNGTVSCSALSLAPGTFADFVIYLQVDDNAVPGTVLNNTATVSSASSDPNGADNSDSAPPRTVSCGTIVPGALPNGIIGTPYAASAAASGGVGPFTYALTGSLPPNLILTPSGAGAGDVTGTPTAIGTFNFDITATSTGPGSCSGTRSYNLVIGSQIVPGDLVVREFRTHGPLDNRDEYVVIHNRSANPLTIAAVDGSAGYAVAGQVGGSLFVIPNGTVIKARGHFLGVNSTAFSLGVVHDASWTLNYAANEGVALFKTANAGNFGAPTVLDAVGFVGSTSPYAEGGVLTPIGVPGETAWVRKAATGVVQDTDNNANDFVLVSTNGASYSGVQSILGSPTPTNSGTWDTTGGMAVQLVEPNAGVNLNPNRIRMNAGGPNDRLEFRRRVTNNTGSAITALRIRFVDLTTLQSPGYSPGTAQADLRPDTSADVTIPATSIGVTSPKGLTVLTPPSLGVRGGLNSVLLFPTGLAPGAWIDVNIALYVTRAGNYRFVTVIEAQ